MSSKKHHERSVHKSSFYDLGRVNNHFKSSGRKDVAVLALFSVIVFIADWLAGFPRGTVGIMGFGVAYVFLGILLYLRLRGSGDDHHIIKFLVWKGALSIFVPLLLAQFWKRAIFEPWAQSALPVQMSMFLGIVFIWYVPLILIYFAGYTSWLLSHARDEPGGLARILGWLHTLVTIAIFLSFVLPMLSAAAASDFAAQQEALEVPSVKQMLTDSKDFTVDWFKTAAAAATNKYNDTKNRLDAVTQTRYTGQVERQQGKPLGVFVRDQNALRTVYRYNVKGEGEDARVVNDFNEDVTWFGTLRARTLLDSFAVGLSCRYDWPGGNVTDECVCRPDNVTVHYTGDFTDEYPFECSVSMEDIPYTEPRGLHGQFYTVADYEFDTWGYTTYAFMDRETMTALRREGKNPAREIGVSQRATARYTPGPVSLGMEAVQQPIGVYPDQADRNFLPQFGITVENAWRGNGEVERLHYLVLQVPLPIELDPSECAGVPENTRPRVLRAGDRFPPPGTSFPQKERETVPDGYTWYMFEDIAFGEDQSFKTVRCQTGIASGASWADLLAPDLSPKMFTFVARTHYDYTSKTPAPARVTVERIR